MTTEQALKIAEKEHLEIEVQELIDAGYSPEEALYEWDLL